MCYVNRITYLLISILFSITISATTTIDYSFMHVDSETGLSQSNVKSIVQDKYGFVWFGTKNGLNRYDGKQVIQLRVFDKELKCGNQNISALYEDNEGILWIGTDNGVYLYNPVEERFTFIDEKASNGKEMRGWVSCITQEENGNVWIVIPSDGIFCYSKGTLHGYTPTPHSNKGDSPQHLCITSDGEIWTCGWYSGLFRYDRKSDSFEQITTDSKGRSLLNIEFNTISQQGGSFILAVQNGGLKRYDYQNNILEDITFVDLRHTFVRNAAVYGDEIWVGTYDGLYIVNTLKRSVNHVYQDDSDQSGLSDNIVYTTYRDHEGGIWIGTMFGGACYLPNRSIHFKTHKATLPHEQSNNLRIREIVEDEQGVLWIGTENAGINKMKLSNGIITPHYSNSRKELNKNVTLSMAHGNGTVYCSIYKNGLEIITANGKSKYFDNKIMQFGESIYAHLIMPDGSHYIGTDRGIYHADIDNLDFEFLPYSNGYWIFDLMLDNSGNIWAASMGNGIIKIDKNGTVKRYKNQPGDPHSLSSNSVSSIMQDSKGQIWFSTDRGGICRFNAEDESFTRFSIEEGLPDDVAYKILEDNDGNLWFGTNRGLVYLNPNNREIKVYTQKDGLCGSQFNYKSAVKGSDGRFYFGTIDGLLSFDPKIKHNGGNYGDIYITKMSIFGNEANIESEGSPLKNSILETEEITLPYNRTNISFDIALLNYSSLQSNRYHYRLEPIDKEWVNCSNGQISYASLLPGKYTLKIRATNEGYGKEFRYRHLQITVSPPWWQTPWAYIIYIIFIIGFIYICFCWYQHYKNKQLAERQKLFEIEKEKELYENKVTFFTEIAHEIRTPLTLINGPLEIIEEMKINDSKLNKNLQVIAQNTKRLLNLVSQLLDFQKVGANKLKLNYETVNVSDLLTETVTRFEPTFTHNGKELIVEKNENNIVAKIDREAITKIMSNLFNNALKYSLHKASVMLVKSDNNFVLTVFSDNERIPKEKAEEIFEPFCQLDNKTKTRQGVGIGLTLSRSLALIHKGSLQLDLKCTEGNAFVLTIPLNIDSTNVETTHINKQDWPLSEEQPLAEENPRGYTVLLVEDDNGLREFIQERLSESFVTYSASNGKEALEILHRDNIDIVVSDVMMPVMSGIDLCIAIKQDIDLCHIPIIFLTAKNDIESKITGLKVGAEAYIEKPFSFEFLKNQILSLLSNRKKEREAFSKRPFFPVKNMQMSKEDEEFMNKVINVINENIADENFNVERMAEMLYMSRSSLLRKIKTLFSMSPLDFIRLIRLKRAAELIQEGKYRVGEICYMVGFNSHSYFSKLFCKQFGIMPKDFEKQIEAERENVRSHGGIKINDLLSDNPGE